ncbi:hypothetical protein ACCO45_003208 [Purpureocillium lilacinum]|uniref:Uncharacterized protein n=1 Tax=Purpureocillium lilacinum TaxID=33203 RepID=A0ACC4E226_PURLI
MYPARLLRQHTSAQGPETHSPPLQLHVPLVIAIRKHCPSGCLAWSFPTERATLAHRPISTMAMQNLQNETHKTPLSWTGKSYGSCTLCLPRVRVSSMIDRHRQPSSGDKALCLPVQGLDPEDTTALVACLAASGVDAFRCLVAAVATASTAPQTLTNRLSWAMSFVAHDIPRVQLVMLLPWFLTRQTGLCSASPAPGYCATVATAAADARRSSLRQRRHIDAAPGRPVSHDLAFLLAMAPFLEARSVGDFGGPLRGGRHVFRPHPKSGSAPLSEALVRAEEPADKGFRFGPGSPRQRVPGQSHRRPRPRPHRRSHLTQSRR